MKWPACTLTLIAVLSKPSLGCDVTLVSNGVEWFVFAQKK
jgi:hypothetical protein